MTVVVREMKPKRNRQARGSMVGRLYFACISSTLHHPRSTVLVCGLEVFATEQSRKPYVQDVDARPGLVSDKSITEPNLRSGVPMAAHGLISMVSAEGEYGRSKENHVFARRTVSQHAFLFGETSTSSPIHTPWLSFPHPLHHSRRHLVLPNSVIASHTADKKPAWVIGDGFRTSSTSRVPSTLRPESPSAFAQHSH